MIDPFVDGDTGDLTETSLQINAVLVNEIQAASPGNSRGGDVALENVKTAGQVIVGTIKLTWPIRFRTRNDHHGLLCVDHRPRRRRRVQANSSIWVADQKLPNAPILLYRNSPMYLKDAELGKQLAAAQAAGGCDQSGYVQTLDSSSITAEAGAALDRRDFKGAIVLFNQSLTRSSGRNMKNFAGLHQAYSTIPTGRTTRGRRFPDLFALGVANNNPSTRFLFTVSSTEFIPNSDLPLQYAAVAAPDRAVPVHQLAVHDGGRAQQPYRDRRVQPDAVEEPGEDRHPGHSEDRRAGAGVAARRGRGGATRRAHHRHRHR